VLRLDPLTHVRVEAWLWLSEISTDPDEQRQCIDSLLAIDANDARARRKLAILNGQLNPAHYALEEKTFQVIINGQTGMVWSPVSTNTKVSIAY
jgi:hypothetical protein